MSVFRITGIKREGNDINVTWQSVGGKTNIIQAATGRPDGTNYTDIPESYTIVNGIGDTITNYVDKGAITNSYGRFYRGKIVE